MTKNNLFVHFTLSLFWFLILFYNPLIFKTICLKEAGIAILYIITAQSIGLSILNRSNIFTDYFILVPTSIFLGSIFSGFLIITIPCSNTILILFTLTLLSALFLITSKNKIKKSTEPVFPYIWIIPALIIILIHQFAGSDYIEARLIIPLQKKNGLPDSYFFTLVTQSYSLYGHGNSFFDYGAGLFYQPVAFYAPAALSKLSDISAQVSLWGIWMPFYKMAAPLVIVYSIIKHFYKEKRQAGWVFLISILLFYGLAPINPKYLLSFNLDKIVWLGTGYLLPGGNPPFTTALLLGGVVMYIFFSNETYNKLDKTLVVGLMALMINTKIAFYIPLGLFLGTISTYNYLYKQEKEKVTLLLISIIPAFVLYLTTAIFQEGNNLTHFNFSPGFYLHSFMKLAGVISIGKGLLIMTGTLLIWFGIRLLIILLGLKASFKETLPYFTAVVVSLTLSVLLPSLLSLQLRAPSGEILQDLTFDLIQFVRGAFFITTIAAIVIIVSQWKIIFSKKLITITIVFFGIVVTSSNAYKYINSEIIKEDQTWRNKVRNELVSNQQTGLYAIKSSRKYSGQILAAEGIGPWWFTTRRGDGSGYIMNNKNYYRAVAMDSLLLGNNPISVLELMKNEDVEVIVATPETKNRLENLKKKGILYQNNNEFWIYRLQ